MYVCLCIIYREEAYIVLLFIKALENIFALIQDIQDLVVDQGDLCGLTVVHPSSTCIQGFNN